jgi:hypothetical protein
MPRLIYVRSPAALARQAQGDLAGAAGHLRGSGWLHAFVPRVPHDDAVLAGLRSRIGDPAFREAQAWGRSAGSKRAVEFALEQA